MKKTRLISDQLIRWSDIYGKSNYHIFTEKTKGFGPSAATYGGDSSRLPDRTLQKMWETRLSVCPWTRAWTQILSFSKPDRRKPSGRLCPAELSRTSRSLPDELSSYKKDPPGNLRYQLRTSASQGAIVGNKHVFRHYYYKHRHRWGSHVGCQYDQRTVKDSVAGNFKHGGEL